MHHTIELAPLPDDASFAIVVARWNEPITRKLLDGAVETLSAAGIPPERIDVAWVPGAWELPIVASRLVSRGKYSAIIPLGAVIRGETSHDQHINRAVSLQLSQLAIDSGVPILLGLLTCESLEQAIHRAGGNVGNKGSECAEAALQMVRLLAAIVA